MLIRRHTTNIGNALFILLLLAAQTTLAAAAFRGLPGHGELHPHLHSSALIVQTQTTPGVPEATSNVVAASLFTTTDLIIGTATSAALEPSSSDTTQLALGQVPVSTDTPTLLSAGSVPPPASSSGSVVASEFLLRASASASPSDASSLSANTTTLSQSISLPGPEAPISTGTQALPDTSSSITRAIHPRPRLLVEIIVPAVLGLLTAGAIFEFYRRRRRKQMEAKGWEGSRLPDLDAPKAGIWPFRRRGRAYGVPTTRTRRAGAAGAAYAGGGGDWNRSDAHLRAEDDVSEYGGGRTRTLGDPAGTDRSSGFGAQLELEQAWDPDPTIEAGGELFTGAFHSESPSHDEPALAESRPGSRTSVRDSL